MTQPGTRQHIHVQFAPFAALLAPEADLRLDLPRVGIAALAAEAYLPFSGRGRP